VWSTLFLPKTIMVSVTALHSVLRDAVKTLTLLLAWIGLVEAGLHVADVQLEGSITMKDWQRQFHLRPGAHCFLSTDVGSTVRINSLGFEDKERTLKRKPGVLRIAVLGSSYVQSCQFTPEQAFPGVMEDELRRSAELGGREVEVLNFGVGGYGLPQQWMTLRDEVWQYDPQIVIEAIGLYNDIVNSDRYTSVSGCLYPYFTGSDRKLVPDEITLAQKPPDPTHVNWENRWNDAANQTKLPLLLETVFRRYRPRTEWQPGLTRDPNQICTFFPPSDPHLENAWRVSETSLRLMQEQCSAHRAEFWIVTLDYTFQADPDPAHKAARLREFGITDSHYPDRRIVEFAKKEGMRTFWLSPLLEEYAEKHRLALHFKTPRQTFLHYNERGHQVVGGLIAGELRRRSDRLKTAVD
jgi:hypothetical protein